MTKETARAIPILLILFRGLAGLVAVVLAVFRLDPQGFVLATLVVLGVLSDVLDGVVARRLGVSTDGLRILDSRIDVVFFVSLIAAVLIRSPNLLWPLGLFFLGLSVLELSVHVISYVRFRKQSSTHHYLSKLFSIFLFGLVVQFFLFPEVTWYFWLVAGVALVSFLEAGMIMLSLNRWQCDIRTVFDLENGEVRRKADEV